MFTETAARSETNAGSERYQIRGGRTEQVGSVQDEFGNQIQRFFIRQ